MGRMGGGQSVFVGPKCNVGNVAHEVLHALGFYHEHTRMDREEHVTVLTDNIMEGRGACARMSQLCADPSC